VNLEAFVNLEAAVPHNRRAPEASLSPSTCPMKDFRDAPTKTGKPPAYIHVYTYIFKQTSWKNINRFRDAPQRHTKTHKDTQRHTKTHKDTQRHTKTGKHRRQGSSETQKRKIFVTPPLRQGGEGGHLPIQRHACVSALLLKA